MQFAEQSHFKSRERTCGILNRRAHAFILVGSLDGLGLVGHNGCMVHESWMSFGAPVTVSNLVKHVQSLHHATFMGSFIFLASLSTTSVLLVMAWIL